MRKTLMVLIASSVLLVGACSKNDADRSLDQGESPSPTGSLSYGPAAPPTGYKALTTDRAPSSKEPTVVIPGDDPPTTLQITDLTVGSGQEATAASTITVNYLLVTWAEGEKVDGSFGAQPLTSPLQGLVEGWKQGIPGMKVGGRRQLVIPPALGYGTDANAHQLGGQTLVFILDLLSVS